MEEERNQNAMLIPGAILVSGLIIAGAIVYVMRAPRVPAPAGSTAAAGGATAPGGRAELEDGNDPVRGDSQSPVTIVEFSDFQCPYCKKFWKDSLPDVLSRYVQTGKARIVYRDFPLMQIHAQAEKAAEAAACAFEQQKFWEFHDAIFENQAALSVANLKTWARRIGLDGGAFDQCLDSGKKRDEVLKDYQDGLALGITGTPSFFVNGELVVGAVSAEEMASVIEQALRKKQSP